MKFRKNIYLWVLIAVVIEICVFGFLDKFYLINDTNFQAVSVSKEVPVKADVKVRLAESAKTDFKLSSNGKMGLYKEGENLKILNTVTGETDEVKGESKEPIAYFTWVPESTRLLLIKKTASGKKFKMYYYDTKSKNKPVEIRNFMDGSSDGDEVYIPIKNPKAEISDVDMSTYNGVIYISIKDNGKKDEVYRMDRMCRLEKVELGELKSNQIGEMFSTKHAEKLVYEDAVTKKIYATGLKNSLMPTGVQKATLLGIDSSDDTVYIGALDGEDITKIYYGHLEEPINKWHTINLHTSVRKEQLYISPSSKLYLNNTAEETITDLRSNKSTKYVGEFIQVFDSGIVSLSNEIINKTPFEVTK